MTVEAPPSLTIEPDTTNGRGLTVPVSKALAHLMVVHQAAVRDWPITFEQANAEVRDAIQHLTDLEVSPALITPELREEIDSWKANLRQYVNELRGDAGDALTDGQKSDLQEIITLTWALLAVIDREITGIVDADPGRLP